MMILRVSDPAGHLAGNDLAGLRKLGVTSELAESAREAREYLRLYDYDLVLLDLHLPEVPGHEAVRVLRAAGHVTPVVVLVSGATSRQKAAILDQGADDVIVTPSDTQEMLARLRAAT